eukprot:747862-Hanusia_phi.AAC.4
MWKAYVKQFGGNHARLGLEVEPMVIAVDQLVFPAPDAEEAVQNDVTRPFASIASPHWLLQAHEMAGRITRIDQQLDAVCCYVEWLHDGKEHGPYELPNRNTLNHDIRLMTSCFRFAFLFLASDSDVTVKPYPLQLATMEQAREAQEHLNSKKIMEEIKQRQDSFLQSESDSESELDLASKQSTQETISDVPITISRTSSTGYTLSAILKRTESSPMGLPPPRSPFPAPSPLIFRTPSRAPYTPSAFERKQSSSRNSMWSDLDMSVPSSEDKSNTTSNMVPFKTVSCDCSDSCPWPESRGYADGNLLAARTSFGTIRQEDSSQAISKR